MKNQKLMGKAIVLALFATVGSATLYAADVPHVFSAGSPAKASEVNENFANLDQRLDALESRGSMDSVVDVDCSSDADALINMGGDGGAGFVPNTTYMLTGMCNGPIIIGDYTGFYEFAALSPTGNGISLPPGIAFEDGYSAAAVAAFQGGTTVELDNITVSAENYVTPDSNGNHVKAVHSVAGALIQLQDTMLKGGSDGAVAYGNGIIIIEDGMGNTQITGFGRSGIAARDGGLVLVSEMVSVNSNVATANSYTYGISAIRNGVIRVTDSGTFSAPVNEGATAYAALAADNGTIRVQSDNPSATVTLNGVVASSRSSSAVIKTSTSINGAIGVGDQSHMRLDNVTQQGGGVEVYRSGGLKVSNSDLAMGDDDRVSVSQNGTMRLDSVNVGNEGGDETLGVYGYGYISLRDDTNLNGREIDCVSLQGIGTRNLTFEPIANAGSVSCDPDSIVIE